MNCPICHEKQWLATQDSLYLVSPILVEELNYMFYENIETLSGMIRLTEKYCEVITEIEGCLNKIHSSCRTPCPTCGHVNQPNLKGFQTGNKLGSTVLYYTGLQESQCIVLENLKSCISEMKAIDQMIGMDDIKRQFVEFIKYMATFDKSTGNKPMMHMVITGPPGHGKTEIAKLLALAFQKSGLLTSDAFVVAKRSDLIGKYCGHTAVLTTEVFDSANGGVVFIDEVYSLGNPQHADVFTGECINTINQLLSDPERAGTMCIVAGYEDEVETCFFSYNPGLSRRFPWRFSIKPYTAEHLVAIFYKKIAEEGLNIRENALVSSDIDLDKFPNAGGDIANLVTNTLLCYHTNNFIYGTNRPVSRGDVLDGITKYMSFRKVDKRNDPPFGMYL